MATPSPIVSMAPTRVTTTKAGSSAQNSTPGVSSIPGHASKGAPTQAASSTCCVSYSPKNAATAQPAAMPMTGDHRRNAGGARSTSPATTTIVTTAAIGAASGDVPSGTSFRASKTTGMTVAVISMMTVPETTGVRMRRISESRAAIANWNSDDTATRLAIVAGPPSTSAATHTAMKAPEVPMMSTYPDPTRPTRTACRTVVTPLTISAAKTAQVM